MNSDNKDGSADKSPTESEDKSDAAERLARYAKYTSPAMLALLVSGGQNMAFAINTGTQ